MKGTDANLHTPSMNLIRDSQRVSTEEAALSFATVAMNHGYSLNEVHEIGEAMTECLRRRKQGPLASLSALKGNEYTPEACIKIYELAGTFQAYDNSGEQENDFEVNDKIKRVFAPFKIEDNPTIDIKVFMQQMAEAEAVIAELEAELQALND